MVFQLILLRLIRTLDKANKFNRQLVFVLTMFYCIWIRVENILLPRCVYQITQVVINVTQWNLYITATVDTGKSARIIL